MRDTGRDGFCSESSLREQRRDGPCNPRSRPWVTVPGRRTDGLPSPRRCLKPGLHSRGRHLGTFFWPNKIVFSFFLLFLNKRSNTSYIRGLEQNTAPLHAFLQTRTPVRLVPMSGSGTFRKHFYPSCRFSHTVAFPLPEAQRSPQCLWGDRRVPSARRP